MYEILGLMVVLLSVPAFYLVTLLIFGPFVWLKERRRKKQLIKKLELQNQMKNKGKGC